MKREADSGSIDEYIAAAPLAARPKLEELRALIKATAPEATERISYGIPTFDLAGRHLVHFGGYERHVGLYPTPGGIQAFKDELAPYEAGKGTIQFPLDAPLPSDLVRRIVEHRVKEVLSG